DNRRRSWQWLDSDEPPRKFPKPPLHLRKTMLIVFWSHFGMFISNFSKLDSRSRRTIITIYSKPPWKNCWRKGRHWRTDAGSSSSRI
ncbi:hypothetical protein M514_13116, partial [Trichuris suis]